MPSVFYIRLPTIWKLLDFIQELFFIDMANFSDHNQQKLIQTSKMSSTKWF